MLNNKLLILLPDLEGEEMMYINTITKELTEDQLQTFAAIYSGKRKKSDIMLVATLVGFLGISGIQRFLIGQMGMGILYLLTGGLCVIGTIVDLVNYKKLATEHNQKAAAEALGMTKMMSS